MSRRVESASESSRLSTAYDKLDENGQKQFLNSVVGRLWPVGRRLELSKPDLKVREAIDFTFTDEQGETRPVAEIQKEMIAFTNQQAAELHQNLDKLISLIKQR